MFRDITSTVRFVCAACNHEWFEHRGQKCLKRGCVCRKWNGKVLT